MQRRSTRWLKWSLICLGAVCVAALAWGIFGDSPMEFPEEVSRAAVVVYGTLREQAGRRDIVVEEIWKSRGGADQLTVGKTLSAGAVPPDGHPDGVVVLFDRPRLLGRGRLRLQALFAVYQGKLGQTGMSVAEAKALCAANPSI
jgi:hypothetical protein